MSFEFYKVVHIVGVILLFYALGGMTLQALRGKIDAQPEEKPPGRALMAAFHGIALVLLLVAGFGALVKLGTTDGVPGWVWGKLVVWLLLAASPVLIKRKPNFAKALWFVLPLLGVVAVGLAVMKP